MRSVRGVKEDAEQQRHGTSKHHADHPAQVARVRLTGWHRAQPSLVRVASHR